MSDPAVEAAQRVLDRAPWVTSQGVKHFSEAAAREALKPIRERHRPFDRPIRFGSEETERVCNYCLGPRAWPCPDALDAYTSEELGCG